LDFLRHRVEKEPRVDEHIGSILKPTILPKNSAQWNHSDGVFNQPHLMSELSKITDRTSNAHGFAGAVNANHA
jgi:hypothetical protein